jgi:hypothetical protein
MIWSEIPWRPAARLLREFSVLWLLFCVALGWLYWWDTRPALLGFLLAGGLALGVAGLAVPAVIRPLFVGWMVLAYPVGWLVLHASLAAVYFGLLTPVGALFRWRGRDLLQLRPDPTRTSMWAPKRMPADPAQYYRMF